MALMERVATLLRANLQDLLRHTENPERILTQLVLDMENQLLQLKTQVAMALADKHMLEKKVGEQQSELATWQRRAELSVGKGDDTLARAALERALQHEQILTALVAQAADQTAEAEALRSAFVELQAKHRETKAECELLILRHRRARLAAKTNDVQTAVADYETADARTNTLRQVRNQALDREAQGRALRSLPSTASLEDRLATLERQDRVEQLLAELKNKQRLLPTS